jgi:pimeloyl-ACP methyl ester carboxylesterase
MALLGASSDPDRACRHGRFEADGPAGRTLLRREFRREPSAQKAGFEASGPAAKTPLRPELRRELPVHKAKSCSEVEVLEMRRRAVERLTAESLAASGPALVSPLCAERAAARSLHPLRLCRALLAVLVLAALATSFASVAFHRAAEKVAIDPARMRWVMQSDGRLLEYATCGRSDGVPVYWATGYFSTANFFPKYACEGAERLGLRLLSISMPGFGMSDSYPLGHGRSLLDWPLDVELVLAQEGIRDVFLMGTSTGCVHAASFAHAFPERVLGAIMNAPTAPHEAVREAIRGSSGMSALTLYGKEALHLPYVGSLLSRMITLLPVRVQLLMAYDVYKAMMDMERLGGVHREIQRHLEDDFARYYAHTYRGVSDNIHTIVDELPFELKDLGSLTRRGLKFWITTSPDDGTNPPPMQQWWAREVPGSELLHFDAGWGHIHAFTPENLDYLLGLVSSSVE